jgi:ubiquinone/menaquinone biosynthesis C-methylase UbiE
VSQKELFLSGEADSWYLRNKSKISSREDFPDVDFISQYVKTNKSNRLCFLEIGCGAGNRTFALAKKLNAEGFGIDPSKLAIGHAINFYSKSINSNSVSLAFEVGTSEELNFPDGFFDLIYFGFCLYLIDRKDLKETIAEALRTLKPSGTIAILDFDTTHPYENTYHHNPGVRSFKDDYPKYFIESNFRLMAKLSLYENGEIGYEDEIDKRVALSLLRRG